VFAKVDETNFFADHTLIIFWIGSFPSRRPLRFLLNNLTGMFVNQRCVGSILRHLPDLSLSKYGIGLLLEKSNRTAISANPNELPGSFLPYRGDDRETNSRNVNRKIHRVALTTNALHSEMNRRDTSRST
jgi:hypothetical protein